MSSAPASRELIRVLPLAVSLGLAFPCLSHAAEQPRNRKERGSTQLYLADAPADITNLAKVVQHLVGVVQSMASAEQEVKRVRADMDTVKTRHAAVTSELELMGEQRKQLREQLAEIDAHAKARFGSLQKDLEAKLSAELARTRQQLETDQREQFSRQVKDFEVRQEEAISKSLDAELEMRERELAQLSEEIEMQTQELVGSLSQLDASADAAKALERSTKQALIRRQAQLQERRNQLAAERSAVLSKQRSEFSRKLQNEQQADRDRRLTLKEASLRSAMAELLNKTEREEAGKVMQARDAFQDLETRFSKLTQQHAMLSSKIEAGEKDLRAQVDDLESLAGEREATLAKLEEVFEKQPISVRPQAISWLSQTIRYLPAEVSNELVPIQQRLIAFAEQEEKLARQRKTVREKQLALQLSREMEQQHAEAINRERRDREARGKKADAIMEKAHKLAGHGKYDEALALVAEAQALNPPQMQQIVLAREQILADRAARFRQAEAQEIERLFGQAMNVYEQGRYEEAIGLFEEVISQEAKLGPAAMMGSGSR
jgi:hypothetical protein